VIALNDFQKQRFTRNMLQRMFNTVTGKRIALFGFAFKKDTGDSRESPAVFVAKALLEEGAKLRVYDPQVILFVQLFEVEQCLCFVINRTGGRSLQCGATALHRCMYLYSMLSASI
jgi:UDP-glucose 6-dehydrogenase